jgi:hypothetical protein
MSSSPAKQLLRAIDLIEHTKSRCRPRRVLFDEMSRVFEIIYRTQPNGASVLIDFEKIKPIVHSASRSVKSRHGNEKQGQKSSLADPLCALGPGTINCLGRSLVPFCGGNW